MSQTAKRGIKGVIWAVWITLIMMVTISLLEISISRKISELTQWDKVPETLTSVDLQPVGAEHVLAGIKP